MKQKEASFTKGERLCGVKAISDLFSTGRALYLPPLRIVYQIMPEDSSLEPARVLVSVPKRNFKKAVDRNLIRRRVKEAYRKNKMPLIRSLFAGNKHIDLAILWVDNAIQPYDIAERSIKEMIVKLSHLV
ncbi:MAG: ribonuclease P protein component [Bacteroidales bacterium]